VQIEIDLMQETDLDEVMRIEEASFKFPWKRNLFLADLSHSYATTIVARPTGTLPVFAPKTGGVPILGYAVAWRVEDELHLANIAVAPELREQGIGDQLLNRVFEIGQELGCRRIYLEVRPSNIAAQRLYRKHGFFHTLTRPAYYPDQEAALVYEKEL
jgi:ribosomal-protein-alanine N-acetyltransferase